MRLMLQLMNRGLPASDVSALLAAEERRLLDQVRLVGRNDPCPCGSGRKVKKCHGEPSDDVEGALPTVQGVPRPPATERGRRAAARRGSSTTG
ncbi:MAG: SEC-C metal-binding domain-containing protein [Acidimicrobiia bacterium]|jgi:hypothetical protein